VELFEEETTRAGTESLVVAARPQGRETSAAGYQNLLHHDNEDAQSSETRSSTNQK
jgi:hypothetical protein